ncbi:MAG: hypothetical protein ACK41D_12200 [Rubricoccaceae bacterium]
MNIYTSPQVTDMGDLHTLTGVFGSSARADVLVGPNGQPTTLPGLPNTGSIDACPTQNPGPGGTCQVGGN